MSETPTPETDRRIGIISNGSNVVDASWARELERERDEANKSCARLAKGYNAIEAERDEARTLGDTYGQKYAACILEREKLKAELKQMSMCLDASNAARAMLGNERDQLRKVADELADVVMAAQECFSTGELDEAAISEYNSLPHVLERNKAQ